MPMMLIPNYEKVALNSAPPSPYERERSDTLFGGRLERGRMERFRMLLDSGPEL